MLGLVGCIAATTWLYDHRHFSFQWPRNIQQEVLGTTIATDDSLISKERHFSQFGEGFARWRYKADASASDLRRLCGETDVATCQFTRSRKVEDGADVSVSLSRGVLTIEEVWN
ncbi:hypothetical protein V6R86_12505 [Sphingomonas kaistensis]|uniref:Uncharacterized protein n=1 Tax=Sphingomonas kaistensis TaxID=298708 RepID=A0ABZ2G5P7_9SPHN